MTFVVAGVVLLFALLVGTVFDDDEASEDDPPVHAHLVQRCPGQLEIERIEPPLNHW